MSRTPSIYRRATWYAALPLDVDEGVVGLAVRTTDDRVVERFAIERASAVRLLASLAESLGYEVRSCGGSPVGAPGLSARGVL